MCRRILVISTLCLATAALAPGQIRGQTWPDPAQCDASVASLENVGCVNLPDGTGTVMDQCFGPNGLPGDATITVWLRDAAGNPVVGFDARNIRIQPKGHAPGVWCDDSHYPPPDHAPNCADAATDASGETTFSRSYHGGNWWLFGTEVYVLTAPGVWSAIPTTLNILFNSPDIDGSLTVDLLDVTEFAEAYFGPYAEKADFNWDGFLNLPDVVTLAASMGKTCP